MEDAIAESRNEPGSNESTEKENAPLMRGILADAAD